MFNDIAIPIKETTTEFTCNLLMFGGIELDSFLRPLIDLQFGLTQSYHHKRLNKEARRPNFLEFIFF